MKIACIGYGGHAKVIVNIIKKIYKNAELFIFDDVKKDIPGISYVGRISDIDNYANEYYFICCIGNLKFRQAIIQKKLKWLTLVDPSSVVAQNVKIDEGTVIMAGVICQPECIIGKHCIINTRASIDHECVISNNVHIAPGSTLCGSVKIGANTFIGAGSTIVQNVTIGCNNVIGAGSVVLNKKKFSKDDYMAFGVPCQIQNIV